MWLRWFPQRPSAREKWLLVLALALATTNTAAGTVAASTFLSRVGADGLAWYYLGFAALSVPTAILLARMLRASSADVVLGRVMVASVGVLLGSSLLISSSGDEAVYALYLGVAVLEQLSYALLYGVMADRLTATETTKIAPWTAVMLALGGAFGGGVAALLADGMSVPGFLATTSVVALGSLLLLGAIRRRVASLSEEEEETAPSLAAAMRSWALAAQQFPIVVLLATAVFVNVMLESLVEWAVFDVYAKAFPDPVSLTQFLGLLHAGLYTAGAAAGLLLAGPLLRRLGVAQANLVYPALVLAAVAAFLVHPGLLVAVLVHTVCDPLEHAVDVPVQQATYNAVPDRLVARLRVVVDGIVYPTAMATAGAVLVVLAGGPREGWILWIALALAGAFAVTGVLSWRWYGRGLARQVETRTIAFATEWTPPAALGTLRRTHSLPALTQPLGAVSPFSNAVPSQLPPAKEARWMSAIVASYPHEAESILLRYLRGAYLQPARDSSAMARQVGHNDVLLQRAWWTHVQQALHATLQALSALGYHRTQRSLRLLMQVGGTQGYALALEALASVRHRAFVVELLPLLQHPTTRLHAATPAAVLATLQGSPIPWVAATAAFAAGQVASVGPALQSSQFATPAVAAAMEMLMEHGARMELIATAPLFSSLALEDVQAVAAAMGSATYLPNEAVITAGDAGEKMFVIASGAVAVFVEGRSAAIEQLGPGDAFGEMALFDDAARSATVVATATTEVLTLSRDRFTTLGLQRPQVLLGMCQLLGQRLRDANVRLAAATQTGAAGDPPAAILR